jgi:P27 family predicted phage terminase small subunit
MGGVKGRGGRRPKPNVVKLITGNPGRRPLLEKHTPQPKPTMPRCPSHLDAEAKREWKLVAPQLYGLGLLTEIDRDALAVYCSCYSQWVMAERYLQEHGLTIVTPQGIERASPWVKIALDAQRLMFDVAREFGMTPPSRARIRVEPPPAPDPFRELLEGA